MSHRKAAGSASKREFQSPSVLSRQTLRRGDLNTSRFDRTLQTSVQSSRLQCTKVTAGVSEQELLEVQCDLIYNEYLQAAFMKDLVEEAAAKHTIVLNDQISIQKDKLFNKEAEYKALEEKVTDMEKEIALQESLDELALSVKDTLKTLGENRVVDSLNILIPKLEDACKKLYVKNVNSFKNQEDVDEFENSLQTCTNMMDKLSDITGHPGHFKELKNLVSECQALKDKIKLEQLQTTSVQKEMSTMLFEVISDIFKIMYNS